MPDTIDVWSFRALERLKVHEARTKADLLSRVERPGRISYLNLRVARQATSLDEKEARE